MVDKYPERFDALFGALADPIRRAMLHELAAQPLTVGALAAPFQISLAGASKHIQVLERAGFIQREVQGRAHICRLDARPLHAGAEWFRHYERFWKRKLDILESMIKAEDAAKSAPKPANEPLAKKRKER